VRVLSLVSDHMWESVVNGMRTVVTVVTNEGTINTADIPSKPQLPPAR